MAAQRPTSDRLIQRSQTDPYDVEDFNAKDANDDAAILDNHADEIDVNTNKVGITTQQANDIVANNAKIGVTDEQKNSDILKAEIEAKLTGEITSHTHEVVLSKKYSWTWSEGVDFAGTHLDFVIVGASAGEIAGVGSSEIFVGSAIQFDNYTIVTTNVTNDTFRVPGIASDNPAGTEVNSQYNKQGAESGGGLEREEINSTVDDSIDIVLVGEKEFTQDKVVTGSTHSITIAATGHQRGAIWFWDQEFQVDCDFTINNYATTKTTIGTVNPIPAGTYNIMLWQSSKGVGVIIQNNTGTTPGTLSTPTLVFSVGNGQLGYSITGIDPNATDGILEYSTDNVIFTTWGAYSFGSETGNITGLSNGQLYYGRYRNSAIGYTPSLYGTDSATPSTGVTQLTAPTIGILAIGGGVTIPFTNSNGGNEDANRIYYKLASEPTIWTEGVLAVSGATSAYQLVPTSGDLYDFKIVAIGSGIYSNSNDSNIVSGTPILLEVADDFAGTTLDTGKWLVTNPANTQIVISQNNKVFFTMTGAASSVTAGQNSISTIDSIPRQVLTYQFDIDYSVSDLAYTTPICGIYIDGLATTDRAIVIGAGEFARLFVASGGSTVLDVTTAIPLIQTWKIEMDADGSIRFYYLTAPNTWTLAEAEQTAAMGNDSFKGLLSGNRLSNSTDGDYTSYDNVYFRNTQYATSTP